MRRLKPWWLGFLLIVIFVHLGELTIVLDEYIYQLGLDRNIVLILLWFLPVVASYLAVSRSGKIILGLSYIPVLSLLGPVVHFLFGEFGAKIDFGGLAGLRVTVPIEFFFSVITIGTGSVAGKCRVTWPQLGL